jgi:hypothetical protein
MQEGLIDITDCDVSILDAPQLDFDGEVFIERVGIDGRIFVRVRSE